MQIRFGSLSLRVPLVLAALAGTSQAQTGEDLERLVPSAVHYFTAAEVPITPVNFGHLKVGGKLPPLMLKDDQGQPFDLNAACREQPIILVAYRHLG